MTQDNIQKDTPQENANEQQYASLEEAVFGEGSNSNESSAFTSGEEGGTETAPQGQPQVGTEETIQQGIGNENDQVRYQYWQSQADKIKIENEQLKTQLQQTAQQQVAQQQTGVQPQAQPQVEEFPAPPEKPQRPRAFNREEAYSDPSSDSSRYLDELEGWRDEINEYNSLKTQYQSAVIEDKFNKLEQSRVNEAKRQQAAQAQAKQVHELKNHMTGHYGMNEGEANDFMKKMSDPNSINIDNLVQLYRFQNNINAQQQQQQQQQAPVINEPSQVFTQTKNAQQVPSPMGVMPSGQSNADTKSFEDKMMDTMIGSFNSKNPWK
jgi:hypothetical protein